jgi:hypothetical protein
VKDNEKLIEQAIKSDLGKGAVDTQLSDVRENCFYMG